MKNVNTGKFKIIDNIPKIFVLEYTEHPYCPALQHAPEGQLPSPPFPEVHRQLSDPPTSHLRISSLRIVVAAVGVVTSAQSSSRLQWDPGLGGWAGRRITANSRIEDSDR